MNMPSGRFRARRYWIVGLAVLAAPRLIFGQADNAALRQRFFAEAPAKWAEAERFATKLQGTVSTTLTVSYPDRKINDTDTIRFTVQQNERCALLRGSPVQSRRNDPLEYLFLTNPHYAAYIRRDPNRSKGFLLRTYEPDPNAILAPAPAAVRDWAFVSLFPHFAFQGFRLSQLIRNPGFQLERIEESLVDGRSLVRVTAHYKETTANPKRQPVVEANLIFDPELQWCLREYQEKITQSKGQITNITARFELKDHPSGIPLVSRQSAINKAISGPLGQGGTQRTIEYDLQVDDSLPDTEFALSAFGLPEPVGTIPERSAPRYIWLLIATIGFAAVAVLFRWLARRSQPAPSATP